MDGGAGAGLIAEGGVGTLGADGGGVKGFGAGAGAAAGGGVAAAAAGSGSVFWLIPGALMRTVSRLTLGAELGFGGKVMRTVSFFGGVELEGVSSAMANICYLICLIDVKPQTSSLVNRHNLFPSLGADVFAQRAEKAVVRELLEHVRRPSAHA